jgi:hypothetical protein
VGVERVGKHGWGSGLGWQVREQLSINFANEKLQMRSCSMCKGRAGREGCWGMGMDGATGLQLR